MDACVVSITAGSPDEASNIANGLLDAHLAACVQIAGPVESRYWWQGRRETATEWVCVAKSRVALVDDIVAAVRRIHSYETPEIVATPVVGGDPEYLAWVVATTSGRGDA